MWYISGCRDGDVQQTKESTRTRSVIDEKRLFFAQEAVVPYNADPGTPQHDFINAL
ncbi:hypothetical protein KIN20_035897 [Parelaphostrongylus tenuis]|uniref:Uncharacterized protein n=1 Tax=Parelaphostrongylus tenuis TaxID=148309 RepID=A0AAD5RBW4_PARTN|nr:hypothetical protein KIN20_035897 [Parelaphostrongylus tenuis]